MSPRRDVLSGSVPPEREPVSPVAQHEILSVTSRSSLRLLGSGVKRSTTCCSPAHQDSERLHWLGSWRPNLASA